MVGNWVCLHCKQEHIYCDHECFCGSSTSSANGDWQNHLPDQWWFWTPEWQEGERQVNCELASGQYEEFETMDDFLKSL